MCQMLIVIKYVREDRNTKKQELGPIKGGQNWDEDKNTKRIK